MMSLLCAGLIFTLGSPYDGIPVPQPPESSYEVGAILCDLWNHGEHYGWDPIKPYLSRKPYLGWYDQDNPEVWDWQIRWARNYGIKWFLHCWYNKGPENEPIVDNPRFNAIEVIEQADLKNYIRYAISWTIGTAADARSADDIQTHLYDYWKEHYFSSPRYFTFDGKLVVAIIGWQYLIDRLGSAEAVAQCLDVLRSQAAADGFGGITFLARNENPAQSVCNEIIDCGFDAQFSYACAAGTDYMDAYEWFEDQQMTRIEGKNQWLTDIPTMSMGWFKEPWNPETHGLILHVNPDEYKDLAGDVKTFMDAQPEGALNRKLALMGTWNEYGEGHWVMPTAHHGFGYLNAVRETFTDGGSFEDDVPTEEQIAGYESRVREWAMHLKLDETAGTAAADDSVFGHDGELSGGCSWHSAGGQDGGALELDGSSGYIHLAETAEVGWMHEPAATRTVMMWINADTVAGTQTLFDEGGTHESGAYGFGMRIHDGMLEARFMYNGGKQTVSAPFASTGSWHHVAYVFTAYGGGTENRGVHRYSLYIDGILVDYEDATLPGSLRFHQDAGAAGATAGGDVFGTTGSGPSHFFDGKLDDLMVSYSALNVLQIHDAAGLFPDDPKMEAGFFVIEMPSWESWYDVELMREYSSPVVVVSPPTFYENDPCVMRMKNFSSSRFETQLAEFHGSDHVRRKHENCAFWAVEAGAHAVGGQLLEAGRVSSVNHEWQTVNFLQTYSNAPVVVCSLGSRSDDQRGSVRVKDVTASGFSVCVQEGEGCDGVHNAETIHYIAAEEGVFDFHGTRFRVFRGDVDSSFTTVNYGETLSYGGCLAQIETVHDSEPCSLRIDDPDRGAYDDDSVVIKIEEDVMADSEQVHAAESVGFIAFGQKSTTNCQAVLESADDSWINGNLKDDNYGSSTTARLRNDNAALWAQNHPLFKFDTSAITTNLNSGEAIKVTDVRMRFYVSLASWPSSATNFSDVVMVRNTEDFSETNVTWNTAPSVDEQEVESLSWFGFSTSPVYFTGTNVISSGGWLEFQSDRATLLVEDWVNGSLPNYGVSIQGGTNYTGTGRSFYLGTGDHATEAVRPEIIVDYDVVPASGF
jgi:hypothetical protein